ncbi:MAG: 4Fe-4S binding protein [Oscillospiraceae bacterium]|nr:4Fe-4S binding protein [Oscillospiraceae bacterium]MCD7847693.1 4Fe-4S binding protein [Oscillospiraceae bacterium]MCD8007220.1 4Fe-4S binding protein [Oscillospiraceae bacterium]
MKRVYVNEKWCLGCHLCEYNCAFANSGLKNMAKLKGQKIYPRIRVEGDDKITFAISCRHCEDPICIKSCISGALSKTPDGMVEIDKSRCVGCLTCVLVCPYGAVIQDGDGAVQKCELCLKNSSGAPACVAGCPNNAIVYEER